MRGNWTKFTSATLLGFALAIAGCESTGGTERLIGPAERPVFSDGAVLSGEYKPVKVFCDKQSTRTTSKIIRPSGGEIGLAGTVLIVPRGAVAVPTLFVMEANNAGCKSRADMVVKFEAYVQDANRKYTVRVGHLGFLQPLELRVNSDVAQKVDASQIRVVWQKTDGAQQVYDTDIAPDGRYRSYLNHFSDYMLAMP